MTGLIVLCALGALLVFGTLYLVILGLVLLLWYGGTGLGTLISRCPPRD